MKENSTMDPRKFITGSNVIQIARAIKEQRPLWTIVKMVEQEKKTRILKDILRRPVLDPMTPIPEDTTDMGVLTSMLPGSDLFIKQTTLYDICIGQCIENRNKGNNKEAEHYKEVFEFLLTQNQKKENFAELAVKLIDYTILNPKSDRGLLDAMEKHKDKINFNQTVFIPYTTNTNNNDSREPSVSSSNSQTLSPDRVVELYRHSIQQEQQKRQNQGETIPLGKFLNVVKTSENQEIAAFAEAIMPSKNVVDPNLTQHLTQPRECPQR